MVVQTFKTKTKFVVKVLHFVIIYLYGPKNQLAI